MRGGERPPLPRDLHGTALVVTDREQTLRTTLIRAAFIAEHLMEMIPRKAWRDSGGDDGQGHYEGDIHAEDTMAEIQTWKRIANDIEEEEND